MAQWYTPNQRVRHKSIVNAKLEKCPMDRVPWEPSDPPLTFFNNSKKHVATSAYDTLFNFKEGWDHHMHRCDRHNLTPIHENIFLEEKEKVIPVLSSLIYGRPAIARKEDTIKGNGKVTSTKSFYSLNGTNMSPDLERSVLPACGVE